MSIHLLKYKPEKMNLWVHLSGLTWLIMLAFNMNGLYLLYTPDSAAYVLNARELLVPGDRSVFYSLYIYVCSNIGHFLGISTLWITVIPIFLMIYGMLYQWVQRFFFPNSPVWQFISLSLAGLLTPFPWFIIQIMPDVFTGILFLSLVLFLVEKIRFFQMVWGAIALAATLMHNGNLIVLTIVVLVLLVSKSVWEILMIQARRIYYLGIISFLGWMSVLLSNWLGGNGWTTAKCSHIFIVAQMSETGVLKHYLDKYCDEGPSIMCKYKDSLPEHAYGFIWPQDGILMKTGGWYHSDTLYGKIIKTVLTDPELLMHYTGSALKSTSYQLISLGVGDGIFPVDSSSTLAVELKNRYPTDYDALFSDNPQQTGSIAFSDLNEFYRKSAIVLFLASLISIYLIPRKNQFAWIALSFILVLSNAFATSVFANVLMRLNTRGFWILMVVCLFLVLKTISHKLMKEAQ